MKIGVLGATGGTGSVVIQQLLDAGRPVRAAVRGDDGARRWRAAGAETVTFDVTKSPPDEIAAALTGCSTVINAAAAGPNLTGRQSRKVDRDGIIAAIGAAEKAGVRRWIQISMMGSDQPRRIPLLMRRIAAVKGEADAFLAGSGLVWTVIRPPWLTAGPATGHIMVARNLEGGSLARADLAAVAIACLDQPATQHRMFDVAGGEIPMNQALASVADLR